MPPRQPHKHHLLMIDVPRLWLITDERQAGALLPSIQALPPGSAILFRHYRTEAAARRRLFEQVRQWADRAGHLLILSDNVATALRWRADGVHLAASSKHRVDAVRYARQAGLFVTMTAHDRQEMRRANRLADAIFVAPVHATTSHPDQPTLGEKGFEALARMTCKPVIALGGMTADRFTHLADKGGYGWAAIDGLTQK